MTGWMVGRQTVAICARLNSHVHSCPCAHAPRSIQRTLLERPRAAGGWLPALTTFNSVKLHLTLVTDCNCMCHLLIIDGTSAERYSYVHAVWQELSRHLPDHVRAHPCMSLVSAWLSAVLMHATIACRPMCVT